MICYKDMTFCQFSDDCKDGKKCFRALTNTILREAECIGLPISQFAVKPDCFEEA